jgi:hypothetical protein
MRKKNRRGAYSRQADTIDREQARMWVLLALAYPHRLDPKHPSHRAAMVAMARRIFGNDLENPPKP